MRLRKEQDNERMRFVTPPSGLPPISPAGGEISLVIDTA